jgi:hypothetical protein
MDRRTTKENTMKNTILAKHISIRNLLPGADLSRLDVSDSTWSNYTRQGWVDDLGHPVLTVKGYEAN